MNLRRVAVLGAGLSGLAAARRAQAAGHFVRVFERSDRVGGVVSTQIKDGWLIDQGPNTIQETPAVAALIEELGLGAERVAASATARNRFVVRGGRLVRLPLSPPQFLAGSFFSAGTKLKLLREFWKGKAPAADSDPSFRDFIRERFGQEVLCYAAQPFVSGTYAGDPGQLSARYAFPRLWQSAATHGSLIRGQMATAKARRAAGQATTPPLISFRSGAAALPRAMAAGLAKGTVVLGAEITGLRREVGGWIPIGSNEPEFDEVIITLPAKATAGLTVEGGAGSLSGLGHSAVGASALGATRSTPFGFLGEIACPPVTALFAGFRAAAVKHPLNGFGCLVPSIEERNILGILFSSSLFPGRAPEGHVALTIMLGGALQPSHALPTALEAWALARTDVENLLGISEHPVMLEATHYPQAIPQYNLGYGRVLKRIAAVEAELPGVVLSGSYRHGISVPDCLGWSELRSTRSDR